MLYLNYFFFSSRRRHTRWPRDWSSDVCSSDLKVGQRRFRLEYNRVHLIKNGSGKGILCQADVVGTVRFSSLAHFKILMIEPQFPGNFKVLLRYHPEPAQQPLPVSFCSFVQINPGEPGGVVTAEPVAAGKVGQEVSVRAGHLVLDQRPCFGDPVDLASCEMLHQLCLIFKIAQIYPVDRRLSPDIATISPFRSEEHTS